MYRYSLSGRVMPTMREWMQKVIGIDIDHRSPAQVRRHHSALVFHFISETDTHTDTTKNSARFTQLSCCIDAYLCHIIWSQAC